MCPVDLPENHPNNDTCPLRQNETPKQKGPIVSYRAFLFATWISRLTLTDRLTLREPSYFA